MGPKRLQKAISAHRVSPRLPSVFLSAFDHFVVIMNWLSSSIL